MRTDQAIAARQNGERPADPMVTLTVGRGRCGQRTCAPAPSPLREGILRVLAAVLQIMATVAIVRALEPDTAGIYFKGFVIAYGLAALLRGKYELFAAHVFIGNSPRGAVRDSRRGSWCARWASAC